MTISGRLEKALGVERAAASARSRPRGVRRVALPSRRTLGLVALAAIFAAIVPRFGAPLYTLEDHYTDHVRHEYSSWAFLQEGFDVFSTPLAEWSVTADHPHLLWPELPVIYPPGLLAFFLPFGAGSNVDVLSDARVHMVMVMVLAVAAVLASFQLVRTLRPKYEPALGVLLAILGATLYVKWGLNGFIDPLVAGLALLGIYWADRGSYGRGLLALVVALSLQFRLWYLWPVVLALAIRHRREIPRWQLAVSAAIALVSLVAFLLAVPAVTALEDMPGIETNYLALTEGGVDGAKIVALAGAIVLLAIVYASERSVPTVAAIALVLVLIFGVAQWQAWYPVLLTPALGIVNRRWGQFALALAFLETTFFLGGFPDVIRTLQVLGAGIR